MLRFFSEISVEYVGSYRRELCSFKQTIYGNYWWILLRHAETLLSQHRQVVTDDEPIDLPLRRFACFARQAQLVQWSTWVESANDFLSTSNPSACISTIIVGYYPLLLRITMFNRNNHRLPTACNGSFPANCLPATTVVRLQRARWSPNLAKKN